ncbi:fibronectin type III domain-containing protein 7-like [Poeciliopsis prolifica]|uniref:fibronectin type III domain-containing protein 7-like n=1 Tax=Poeciliopsis prolifica TaxID=188132 RepID=UPI00241330BA|nr:fibronectin type III domain-containing protein 7-like [Poeciliopsis prolifica]XP_054900998.1 fibronectin type III domain-containing protein 7-like [Poeciliopsis prolifica]
MGAMKWLVFLVFLNIHSQAAAQSDIQVSVFSTTSKTVILRWSGYSGAASYKVSAALSSSPNDPIAFVMFGPNTVMGSISSLSQDVAYTFTVEALSANQTVLSSGSTKTSTAPDMMDPIRAVKPKDSTTLMVDFNPKTGATSYVIRVENTNGFFREDSASSSPAEIKHLSPYTEYQLSIMAVNDAGRSQPSSPVAAKTLLPPPHLSTSSPSNDSIIVTWTPVSDAAHFTVFMYKFGSSTQEKYNTTDTKLTVPGLHAGSLYIIKSFAWDPEGREGEGSLYVNQTTRPPTPASVSVSVVRSNSLVGLAVSWELSQDVYGTVDHHVTSDQNQNLNCNSTSSSCTLSPVGCGEVHIIYVTASNEAGPSHPSSPVVFITFPCPPESLTLVESSDGNCTLAWNTVPYADGYEAFVKKGDGGEATCNSTSNNCTYQCQCGYTYLMSVLAYNLAGSSPEGTILNYTTVPCCPESVSVSAVSTDTLEITWTASRGAELYQTRAADNSEVVLCNDTAPVCALSDLSCDSSYTVSITPCSEISGCNHACKSHTKDTAPCVPTDLVLNPKNSSVVSVSWKPNNRAANYTVSAARHGEYGENGGRTCTTSGNSCDVTKLPCGSSFEFSVMATGGAGRSLPSFSTFLETDPCCPVNLTVDQVTQAMSNVSWSHAQAAQSFITSLTSPRGHARCHTHDSHCLMGCITCGTNYTVTVETFSITGRATNCTYQGFSSSPCCPSGIKLYMLASNSLRVYWRSTASSRSTTVEMLGTSSNYTCTASPGENSCDVENIQCGDVYRLVVAPLTAGGSKVPFCPYRLYSVTCLGSNIGTVIYRGKRSVD